MHLWDWSRPEVRQQLQIGTILEDYDCGYIRVEGITPEGVVSPTIFEARHLWTWDALQKGEHIIYEQPELQRLAERDHASGPAV